MLERGGCALKAVQNYAWVGTGNAKCTAQSPHADPLSAIICA